jgi:pteridine reductase
VQLSGKIAVVTGGAHRVGGAIARELAAAGARVIVHYHGSGAAAAEMVAALPGATSVSADLRTPVGVDTLFAAVYGAGGLDVLVNSAAGFERAPFEQLDDARWDAMLALNLLAPMRCARAAAPLMRSRGGGAIVNLLDIAALAPWAGFSHYCVAKAGLAMLTRALALELAPAIRTNGIAPGTVAFPEGYDSARREQITRRIPLGRIGAPEDVARAARFLIEEDFLNGVILPVDGGRLAASNPSE